MREAGDNAQTSEEVVDWLGKQRAQGDADKRNLGKNTTGLKAEVDSMDYQGNT